MGALATITTYLFVPESPVRTPGRVDLAGAGILATGLTALLIGISRGADWGWSSPQTLGLVLAGLVVLVAFGLFERRTPQPLVNVRTFVRRPVLTTNLSTVLIGSAMISTFVLVPQLAQLPDGGEIGFGLSATQAGLLLVPGSLASLLVAPLVGRVGERHGSKPALLAGCVLAATALLGMTLAHDSVALVVLWCTVMSAGVGAAFASIPNLVVAAVDQHETGEATGTNTVMRNIGSAVGAQVAGTVIAGHVLANGLPANEGFTIAFAIGTIGALVAAASVVLIPGRAGRAMHPEPAPSTA
jgi:MFS family permease